MIDFASLSLVVTVPLFIAAAVVVWIRRDIDIGEEAGLGSLARLSEPTARASDLERFE
jgi:hypothetical protein